MTKTVASKNKPFRLFRYSGSKADMLRHYNLEPLLKDKTRFIEPYLGSGAASLNYCHNVKELVCFDTNSDIIRLWKWLSHDVTLEELQKINQIAEESKTKGKVDIRELNVTREQMLYLKINICSVMVGQLSSWKIYPKHKLPIEETWRAVQQLRSSCSKITLEEKALEYKNFKFHPEDFIFVDPPYINTQGNYIDSTNRGDQTSKYNPAQTTELINQAVDHGATVALTYGAGAESVFPFKFNLVLEKKVPNIRKGGTITRPEYISIMNKP